MTRHIKTPSTGLYGIGKAITSNLYPVIPAKRAPTTSDLGYQIGQIWVNVSSTTAYILTSTAAATATWQTLGGSVASSGSITSGGLAYYPSGSGSTISSSTIVYQSNGGLVQSGNQNSIVNLSFTNTHTGAGTYGTAIVSAATGSAGQALFTATGASQSWTFGTNNASLFTLSSGTTLATPVLVAAVGGSLTYPLSPNVFATLAGSVTNVTGDGTSYNVVFNTLAKDYNSNMAAGVFTPPVSGMYQVSCVLLVTGLTSSFTSLVAGINDAGATVKWPLATINPGAVAAGGSYLVNFSGSLYLTAGTNTMQPYLQVSGSTKTLGITGGATAASFFTVSLLG